MLPDHETLIRTVLSQRRENVDFIVLFGSQARRDAMPGSDVDVAVSVPRATHSERLELKLNLIGRLTGPGRDFDIVVVEDVGWSLRFRIAHDGVVLYEREDGLWDKFVESVILYYPDWRVFEERFLEEFLDGA